MAVKTITQFQEKVTYLEDAGQRCKKFDGMKKRLQEKGLRYAILYPAMLRVVDNN